MKFQHLGAEKERFKFKASTGLHSVYVLKSDIHIIFKFENLGRKWICCCQNGDVWKEACNGFFRVSEILLTLILLVI